MIYIYDIFIQSKERIGSTEHLLRYGEVQIIKNSIISQTKKF